MSNTDSTDPIWCAQCGTEGHTDDSPHPVEIQMGPFPEHEKLAKVADTSQLIGEFLEWLPTSGIHLAMWLMHVDEDGDEEERLVYSPHSIHQVLAEYYEIDLNKLEDEKVAMLEAQRRLNEVTS